MMSARVILCLLLATLVTADDFNYCMLECPLGGLHILCKKNPIEGLSDGLTCKGYTHGLQDADRTMILGTLNDMRSRVATGKEAIGKQPSAANMVELRWDPELEKTAQGWADECMKATKDQCPVLQDGVIFGQLIDEGNMPLPEGNPRAQTINMVLHKWYEGVLTFPSCDVAAKQDRMDIDVKDKYAQIASAKTTHVGCGFMEAKAEEEKYYVFKMVCNFKPKGNNKDEAIYQIGQPRSACPDGYRGKSAFEGLCGDNHNV